MITVTETGSVQALIAPVKRLGRRPAAAGRAAAGRAAAGGAERLAQAAPRRQRLISLAALLALLLLAAGLRFYRLGELPPGLWFDEAWSSVAARNSAAQGIYPVYFAADFGGMHPAIVYLARLANRLSDNPLSLRYAVAAVSTLTVGAAFFAYRAIFALEIGGRTASPARNPQFLALLASLILAIAYPFVHFSRMGFESSLPALAGLLVFGSLAAALQRERAGWFALSGALLGLSLYSFDTARLFPLALSLAFWGVALFHRRAAWRRYLAWYGLLATTAVLTFLPLGLYFVTHWDVFTARAGVATYHTLGPGAESAPLAIWRNLGRTVGGLFLPGFGDQIARHNLPGRPVFDPFLALLFWAGAARLAWTWKRPASMLLAAWAGVMLLAVILTDGAPTYTRIFGALPALAALAALSGDFSVRPGGKGHAVTRAALVLLLLFSLAVTARDYFGRWAALPQLFDDFQIAEWQAGQLARAALAEGDVFMVPNQIDDAHPTLDWLLGDNGRARPAARLPGLPGRGGAAVYLPALRPRGPKQPGGAAKRLPRRPGRRRHPQPSHRPLALPELQRRQAAFPILRRHRRPPLRRGHPPGRPPAHQRYGNGRTRPPHLAGRRPANRRPHPLHPPLPRRGGKQPAAGAARRAALPAYRPMAAGRRHRGALRPAPAARFAARRLHPGAGLVHLADFRPFARQQRNGRFARPAPPPGRDGPALKFSCHAGASSRKNPARHSILCRGGVRGGARRGRPGVAGRRPRAAAGESARRFASRRGGG
jgi:hypothetical protein